MNPDLLIEKLTGKIRPGKIRPGHARVRRAVGRADRIAVGASVGPDGTATPLARRLDGAAIRGAIPRRRSPAGRAPNAGSRP